MTLASFSCLKLVMFVYAKVSRVSDSLLEGTFQFERTFPRAGDHRVGRV